ncbi:MAG: NADH-quinone oxidoreductase subunit E, partial [Acidimicrobiia bacterium]|nr:NADH-quinone oxidoreductase subunit E [Acidimicrobiia bacterium]
AGGVETMIDELEGRLGPPGVTAGDGMWLRSPCLGQCEKGSAAFLQIAGADNAVIAPVTADQVASALGGETVDPANDTGLQHAGSNVLLQRIGVIDPMSLRQYRDAGGYEALGRAIEVGPDAVIEAIERAGLRGRGGAAFPTAVKWAAVADHPARTKYVVCNADESETGTFKDRVLLEGDPFAIVEAMTIAGFSTGAEEGFIYIRGEYPIAEARLHNALRQARNEGLLGDNVMEAGFDFDIQIRRGAGAYICGEETALFNSIEGYRGEPRSKPPYPTDQGLFGKPTVVNNVETLAAIPPIVTGQATAETKLFCLSGAVAHPGVFEVRFGTTLAELIDLAGGVVGELHAVLVGGAAGSFVDTELLDTPLTFDAMAGIGASLGSGAVMVFNTDADMGGALRRIAAFFRDESCGQCVPCRVGTVRQEEALARMAEGSDETVILADLAAVLRDASICGLGQLAAEAVQSAIRLELVK